MPRRNAFGVQRRRDLTSHDWQLRSSLRSYLDFKKRALTEKLRGVLEIVYCAVFPLLLRLILRSIATASTRAVPSRSAPAALGRRAPWVPRRHAGSSDNQSQVSGQLRVRHNCVARLPDCC